MSNKTELQANNEELQEILDDVKSLPPATAVLYTEQTLTEEQKAQARENLGITGTGVDGLSIFVATGVTEGVPSAVISKSSIHVPDGYSLKSGDLVIANGLIYKINSITGNSVEILYLGTNLNGEGGTNGQRGTGILKVTTAPASYTTATGGKNPIKRMSLSTIKTQAGVSEVLVGDCIQHSYYLYHIYHLDATYAYMDTSQSIRGAGGVTPVLGEDYFTPADKKQMVEDVLASLPTWNGGSY